MNKKELWLRLRSYHFDHLVPENLWQHITKRFGGRDGSTKAFAAKIARKHNWKNGFALKAVSEYKKFIYLGVVSDYYVTPSKIIDVVWHEHLLFSKAYRAFCSDIIEYTFDHNPELIPVANQTAQFSSQFLDTIELYKTEFNMDPPGDIWGITKFNKEEITAGKKSSRKKEPVTEPGNNYHYPDALPLFTYFEGSGSESTPEFSGFDGGNFGGGGSSGGWGSPDSNGTGDSGGDGGSGSGGCSGGCGGGD